jgi:hypothetical protein
MAISLGRDLSPWGMFMNADVVVKAVMIGLVIASIVTWTVCDLARPFYRHPSHKGRFLVPGRSRDV